MKKNILFMIGLVLASNTLVANSNIPELLGITANNNSKVIIISETERKYAEPKKTTSNNSHLKKLMKYTKIKRTPQKETAYGLKMGYKVSKNISISIDVLAQVDIRNSKIKSKEANLQIALSL